MASEDYDIRAVLSFVDQGFTAGLDAAAAKAKSFADDSRLSMEGVGTSLTVAGAAVTAMGVKSIKSFGQFEASLNQAAVVAGGTAKDIGQLDDLANKMGADLPLSAQDCADAMIEMARNGASIADIKQQFPAIAQAATAAGADIKATAGVVQEAMNIWGKSLESPQQAAAILVQTANASNASVEDMQQALATIGGSAGQAGMSLQVTSEAIGLLTNKGFSAAQASMDLNHAILQMMAPSKVAKNAMQDLGISFTDAQGKMKQFPDILRELNSAFNGLNPDEKAQKLKAMFGTAGMQAIVPLLDAVKNKTNDAKVSWDAYAKEQDKAAGSTKKATATLKDQANEMQKNVGSSIEQLGGNWESLRNKSMKSAQDINGASIRNANQMLQWATDSNSATAQFIRGFIGLSPAIGTATTSVGMFLRNARTIAGTIAPGIARISTLIKVGTGIVQVATGAKTVTEAFETLSKASRLAAVTQRVLTTVQLAYGLATGKVAAEQATLSAAILSSPITWIIAGVVAVVAALAIFFTQTQTGRQLWSNFINWLRNAWNSLVQVAQNVWNTIVQVFNSAVNAVRSAWNGITSFFSNLWDVIVSVTRSIWQGLVAFFSPLVNAIASIWRSLVAIVQNVWKSIVDGVKPVIASIENYFSALAAFYRTLWTTIVTVARVIWQGLVIVFRAIVATIMAIWTPIRIFFTVLWTGIVAVARVIWQGLIIVFRTIVAVIRAIWTPITAFFRILWQGILIITRTVWNGLRVYISTVFRNIQTVIRAGMAIIRTIFSTGWRALTTIVSAVWKIITTVVSTAINAVAGIIRAITAAIRGNWSGAWNAIKNVVQTIWNGIRSVVATGINAVRSVVQSVMNAVQQIFSTIWNAIKDIFTNAAKSMVDIMKGVNLFDIGKNIVQGLINGIKSMIGAVGSAIGDIANSVVKNAKGLLGIHSPSTVMRDEVGQYIALGIAEGIDSQDDAVIDSMNKILNLTKVDLPDIKIPKVDLPEINSEQFSASVNKLNANVRSNINDEVQVNNSNMMTRVNQLLERIADKDTTMVLDDGTLVGKTTDQYNDSLGEQVARRDRWS